MHNSELRAIKDIKKSWVIIFVFKEITIWLIEPNIAKHSGSFGNCEVSDIDNRLHRSQRRWRSLRIWGDSLGFPENVQHEVYLKSCIGFASMEENDGGHFWWKDSLVQSVAQLCPTLCDPMNCSTPGLPVHHQLLEFTQTHVHWVGDAI